MMGVIFDQIMLLLRLINDDDDLHSLLHGACENLNPVTMTSTDQYRCISNINTKFFSNAPRKVLVNTQCTILCSTIRMLINTCGNINNE